jgi:hypothetical protein
VLKAFREYAIIINPDIANSEVSYIANLGGDSFLNDLNATLKEAKPSLI